MSLADIQRGVRQGYVFSLNLSNLNHKAVLREFVVLSGFIIGCHKLNNTMLIADKERKLQMLLQKVLKESKKKGLNINCKKTECKVVSKRMNSKYKSDIPKSNKDKNLNIWEVF